MASSSETNLHVASCDDQRLEKLRGQWRLNGKLLTWDRVNDLPQITPPTLVIGAKYDTMDPAHMEMMAQKVQKGRYLFCPNGSHLALYDDQKIYVEGLIKFILDVNAGKF